MEKLNSYKIVSAAAQSLKGNTAELSLWGRVGGGRKAGKLREHLQQDLLEILPSLLQLRQLSFRGCCTNSWSPMERQSTLQIVQLAQTL